MAAAKKLKKYYLSADVYDTMIDEFSRTDNSRTFILGKNSKGVCVTIMALTRTGGCGYFAGSNSDVLTKAMLAVTKQGLEVGGIMNITRMFEGKPGWHNSVGNAPFEQPGLPIFTFNRSVIEVSLFSIPAKYDHAPRSCAQAKNICKGCVGCGSAKYGKLTHHEAVVVPANFDPSVKKKRAPRKTKTTTSKKEVATNGITGKDESPVRKTDTAAPNRNRRRRVNA